MARFLFFSIVLIRSVKFVSGNAVPYLVYLVNTFPIDLNFYTIDALREATAQNVNFSRIAKLDRYEEYMQDEIGSVRSFPDSGFRRLKGRRNVTLMMQVEGQLYHMRALDVVNRMRDVSESPLCQATGPRISRKIHERNLPYEFGCSTCTPSADVEGLTFYELQSDRDAFKWRVPAVFQDVLFLHRHWINNIRDSAQIFALQRNTDEMNSVAPKPQFDARQPIGELRINPDMARHANAQLNGLTVICRSESMPEQTDKGHIVLEADTLLHPNFDALNQSNAQNPENSAAATHQLNEKDRYRVGDFEAFDPDNVEETTRLTVGVTDEHLNLRLSLVWAGWSCCSSCCMEELRGRICRSIESHRSRVGYVSWRKVDVDTPLNMNKSSYAKFCFHVDSDGPAENEEPNDTAFFACMNGVADAMMQLDRRLSVHVLRDVGVPIFSTFFHASASRRILEAALNERFKYREARPLVNASRSDVYPFGSLGQYIQVEECGRYNPQRVKCIELERCIQQQDADRLVGDGLYYEIHHTETPPSHSFYDAGKDSDDEVTATTDPFFECCRDVDFQEVPVFDLFGTYDVAADVSYLFNIDEPTFGRLSAVNWTFSRDRLSDIDRSLPCRVQRKFALDDGRRLAIIELQEDDTTQPYSAEFLAAFDSPDDGRPTSERLTVRLDLNLMRRPVESQTQSQLLLWVGLILIVMLFLVAFAIGFNLFNQRKTEFKLREEVKPTEEPRHARAPRDKRLKAKKKEEGQTLTGLVKTKAKRVAMAWVVKQILD